MRRVSATGVVLGIVYLLVAAAAWWEYQQHPNGFLADILIVLMTMPFTFVLWFATAGSVWLETSGTQPQVMLVAIVVCVALAYLLGALIGIGAQWAFRRLRSRKN
jgi:hypothetical protein